MSDLQEIIAKQAVMAFNQGFEAGEKKGYSEGTRDIFDEVLAALSNLYDRSETSSMYQEAICQAQSVVETLQERYQQESK